MALCIKTLEVWSVSHPIFKKRGPMDNSSTLSLSSHSALGASFEVEHDSLCRHMRECDRANGAWHRVRCTAESLDAFLSGRSVSLVTVASGLLALSLYW